MECFAFTLTFESALAIIDDMAKKERLDVLLVERCLVESRSRAQQLIRAGEVLVDAHVFDKPGMSVAKDAAITIRQKPPFVGRGGLKLEAALRAFEIDVTGLVAADVGASTGGFTDCLLQRDARKVYALDVGYGQLAWSLRQDNRVVVMERTNVRYLDALPEPIDLATIDVSFISLRLILPKVLNWLTPAGRIIALIKPQFEAGPEDVGTGGIVRNPEVHRRVLGEILNFVPSINLYPQNLISSPITGSDGNKEFLVLLDRRADKSGFDSRSFVDAVLDVQPE